MPFLNLKKSRKWESALGRIVPLRRRYFLTRRGTIRTRYLAAPICLLLIAGISAGTLTSDRAASSAASVASLAPTAGDDEAALRMAQMQERMQRYAGKVVEAVESATAAAPKERTIKVGKGDTLASVLRRAGLDSKTSFEAIKAMRGYLDPRKIRPGQEIAVRFNPVEGNNGDYDFSRLTMDVDKLNTVSLNKEENGALKVSLDKKETILRTYAKQANIELSLYGSALKAGIPNSIVAESIRIYSWDIDFQRDIRQGDAIYVMYEQHETKDGTAVESGNVIYARLNVNGQDIPVYRYEMANGDVDFFTADGKSVRKALMSTPIDGARLSSGFGMRRHPVLGYNKMHKGVDFAASTGTPIYAAGDGTIEYIGKWSSYGNYIRIRHNASVKTAYAHMKNFAKDMKGGARVKQGQIIGYVGTTGRSTGPHLHYEVLQNGNQVNPRTVKLQQGETLKGKQLAAFKNHVAGINRQYAMLSGKAKFAALGDEPDQTLR
ncbi:MAG: peptidoglycan DD-metalloendopeptidase family protein [Proteobacteria bacterium]|nr:peptidoglycan DD-metalloendopeptidase family protein [Pseudomonadota bacterium]